MKNHVKKMFFEIVPVILGILIALFINNWKEQRDDQQFISTIMKNMELEIEENLKDLKEVIPLHVRLVDSIYVHLEDDMTLDRIIASMHGFKIASVSNTSWRALQNQNLKLVDYERIAILTDIEEGKEQQEMKLDKMMDFVYEHINSPKREKKLIAALIVEDLITLEEEMLLIYEKFLELQKK